MFKKKQSHSIVFQDHELPRGGHCSSVGQVWGRQGAGFHLGAWNEGFLNPQDWGEVLAESFRHWHDLDGRSGSPTGEPAAKRVWAGCKSNPIRSNYLFNQVENSVRFKNLFFKSDLYHEGSIKQQTHTRHIYNNKKIFFTYKTGEHESRSKCLKTLR